MAEETSKTSIWTWLLPMMMGAFISLATDQISEMRQDKEAHLEKRIEEGKDHFFKISGLTGELFATTKALLEELAEKESTEVSSLLKEYNDILTKLNIHELQFLSILEYHFDKETAQKFEENIIIPLRAYHKKIDHSILTKVQLDLTPSDHEELLQLKNKIVSFNQNFLEYIDGIE